VFFLLSVYVSVGILHQLINKKKVMKKCSHGRADISLLITRLIIGGIFIATGWMKVSDMASTVGFFDQLGIPVFLAYAVGYVELIGGIMIVLGLWTCLVAMILSVVMVFAIWFTKGMGFQGFSMPLVTLAGLVALVGVCGGKYSIKCSCAGFCSSCSGGCSDCSDDKDCKDCEGGTCGTEAKETPKV